MNEPGGRTVTTDLQGTTYYQNANGQWINGTTGQPVDTTPESGPTGRVHDATGRTATTDINGTTFFWRPRPCPPTTAVSTPGISPNGQVGFNLGIYGIKTTGHVKSIETSALPPFPVTNEFDDTRDPLGVGVSIGYKFAPFANNIVVSPFVSFDYLNAAVNHTFPGGSFLGTTANVAGTAGLKIGPQFGEGVWVYGIAGASVLNETLKVNFIPVSSSTDATVPGGTVGAGVAWQPSFLKGFGLPVSLFAEYQHTWWQDAHFNTPAASPFFNYNFRREDDVVKFGFTVSLSAPPLAPAPTYPVKAPALK